MSRLLCKFFGHRRNIHGVRRSGAAWRSTCIHCHQPLMRISRGDWQPCPSEADPPMADDLAPLPLFDLPADQAHAAER